MQFSNAVGFASAKCLLGSNTIHLEPRKRPFSKALAYCHKDETRYAGSYPEEYGERPPESEGARTDLTRIRDIVRAAGGRQSALLAVAEDDFGSFLRYNRGITLYADLLEEKRTEPPIVSYYWGPAGSGKTRAVYAAHDRDAVFPVAFSVSGRPWFDGYDPATHTAVLIDDYYHHWPFHFLLKLLDRYPIRVEVKGGFVHFNSPYIYLTSNSSLDQQYPNMPDPHALWRRIKYVIRYNMNQTCNRCHEHNPQGIYQ